MKQRIWELDVLRGVCILAMTAVHLGYDLAEFYGFQAIFASPLFSALLDHGGILFVLLSGLCATLGHRAFRRGLIVFACGMLCSAVTWTLYRLGFSGSDLVIRFGILHCLGSCMMLCPLFRRFTPKALALLGLILTAAGYLAETVTVSPGFLYPLGLVTARFSSGDYFPLLPFLGWFLLGGVLGKTLYRDRQSRLPEIDPDTPCLRFFRYCGTHSLVIYLVHQPILFLILSVLTLL